MGKTAICLSIASYFENQGTLAASFFWDKNRPGTGLDSIKQFPSTLAHQLASFNEEFKSSLVKRLRQRGLELAQNLPLEQQMRALVVEPMGDLKHLLLSSKDRFIIILDGLDECGDQRALRTLMGLVLMLDALPPTFIVLVSSRPEPQVISAWDDAKDGGLDIPCEDVDKIGEETFRTVRRMVEEGLQDCVKKSVWKPSGQDFDTFASACRGLPVMASIRIRDVCDQTQRGSTLRSEFEYFRDLTDAPLDLKSEYLRILRRAYMSNQSSIRPRVINNYRQVIGMIIAAYQPLSLYSISKLLGVAEDEIRATLDPISSIVALSQQESLSYDFSEESLSHDDPLYPTFYHATMKEFLADRPFGRKSDRPFFISDSKGYFLGLPLLRLINNVIEHNEPKVRPLGDSEKWKGFKIKKQPKHVQYAFRYFFCHLDPSKLSSQDSNGLWSEFDILLKRNLLSFIALSGFNFELPNEFLNSNVHNSTELLKEAKRVKDFMTRNELKSSPWHIYRSVLPFTPPSSPLFKLYGRLSDPVQIFSITGEFSGYSIPLSENTLNARKVMEAELPRLLKKADRSRTIHPLTDPDEADIDHGAAFRVRNIRNGIVAAAALSRDGRFIALGFGNGTIEVADIDHHQTTFQFQCDPPNPPAWIEFICGSHRIATEDKEGNITVFSHDLPPVKVGTLPSGHRPPITLVADNGSFIIRVPRNIDCHWHEHMMILYVSDEPSIHPLSPPKKWLFTGFTMPDRCTLGLSPEGRYVVAHDDSDIVIWSTKTRESVQSHKVSGSTLPVSYHTYHRPHLITQTRTEIPSHLENSIPRVQSFTAGHDADPWGLDADLLWLVRLSRALSSHSNMHRGGFLADEDEVIHRHRTQMVWFNGKLELLLPPGYRPIILDENQTSSQEVWYGDRMLSNKVDHYLPCASKDGTRFLVQGHMQAPIVVDISQVV
ncbi:uncharacterized protein EI90DRAFT_2706512 [Cantharellus anzutake]|uniref:uncharacterized protein n=1 Tax=Cantharellus anzutake TaxID=1750568 RepID=UPI001905B8EC|nr:uncharacterized protein EI90DRAFT_2706512 [Cantharellus anzutake]KAF8318556.1 hypothetical protein EI90DRAFT_2706512 [Cantharellus anzutake]